MVTITLDSLIPSTPPADGWIVKYRIKGSSGAYSTPSGSPYSSFPIIFSTTDPIGTLYEGTIQTDCGGGSEGTVFDWVTPCDCGCAGMGYAPSVDGSVCIEVNTTTPTTTHSGYCLTTNGVGNGAYSNYGSRIYNPGFSEPTLFLAPASVSPYIYGNMSSFSQWANTVASPTVGPMNREAVWIDSNCDGTKDALSILETFSGLPSGTGGTNGTYSGVALTGGSGTGLTANITVSGNIVVAVAVATGGTGYMVGDVLSADAINIGGTTGFSCTISAITYTQVTIGAQYNNTGAARTIFMGVGGDNQFKVVVNGATIVDTGMTVSSLQFKLFHIIPIPIVAGINYFNVIATGDGSVDDAIAMVLYDNTAAQIYAATSDSSLSILFKSSTLNGQTIDTSTCPTGYSLDTSGGSGHYICTQTLTAPCNGAC